MPGHKSVIPAMWEIEVGRLQVQGQSVKFSENEKYKKGWK